MDTVSRLRGVTKSDSSSDIGALVSDSFSSDGGFSDDSRSSSWMQKIDVSNFKQLQQDPPIPIGGDTAIPIGGDTATLLDHGRYSRPPDPAFPSPAESCSSTIVMSPPIKQKRYNHQIIESSEEEEQHRETKIFPKPIYSYSCLIALSLKNSKTGRLTVAEIYSFMCENFPYFLTAPAGWKNSVRHNLSLNKCFEKIELEAPGGHGRKSCLWTMNPAKKTKMDSEIRKWREKDVEGVHEALANPADLEAIEAGLKGLPGANGQGYLMRNFPDIIRQQHPQSQLLLVERPTHYTHYTYSPHTNRQPQLVGTGHTASLSWGNEESSSPGGSWSHTLPPCTPPRPNHSPYIHTGGDSYSEVGSAFSTPHHMRSSQLQSSPFAHTPPYSPNVHSPQFTPNQPKPVHTDWLSAVSANATPRQAEYHHNPRYQPTSLEEYYASNSPLKMNMHYGAQNPYDTTHSALHNNSLLQTALAQSPCRADFTLQRL